MSRKTPSSILSRTARGSSVQTKPSRPTKFSRSVRSSAVSKQATSPRTAARLDNSESKSKVPVLNLQGLQDEMSPPSNSSRPATSRKSSILPLPQAPGSRRSALKAKATKDTGIDHQLLWLNDDNPSGRDSYAEELAKFVIGDSEVQRRSELLDEKLASKVTMSTLNDQMTAIYRERHGKFGLLTINHVVVELENMRQAINQLRRSIPLPDGSNIDEIIDGIVQNKDYVSMQRRKLNAGPRDNAVYGRSKFSAHKKQIANLLKDIYLFANGQVGKITGGKKVPQSVRAHVFHSFMDMVDSTVEESCLNTMKGRHLSDKALKEAFVTPVVAMEDKMEPQLDRVVKVFATQAKSFHKKNNGTVATYLTNPALEKLKDEKGQEVNDVIVSYPQLVVYKDLQDSVQNVVNNKGASGKGAIVSIALRNGAGKTTIKNRFKEFNEGLIRSIKGEVVEEDSKAGNDEDLLTEITLATPLQKVLDIAFSNSSKPPTKNEIIVIDEIERLFANVGKLGLNPPLDDPQTAKNQFLHQLKQNGNVIFAISASTSLAKDKMIRSRLVGKALKIEEKIGELQGAITHLKGLGRAKTHIDNIQGLLLGSESKDGLSKYTGSSLVYYTKEEGVTSHLKRPQKELFEALKGFVGKGTDISEMLEDMQFNDAEKRIIFRYLEKDNNKKDNQEEKGNPNFTMSYADFSKLRLDPEAMQDYQNYAREVSNLQFLEQHQEEEQEAHKQKIKEAKERVRNVEAKNGPGLVRRTRGLSSRSEPFDIQPGTKIPVNIGLIYDLFQHRKEELTKYREVEIAKVAKKYGNESKVRSNSVAAVNVKTVIKSIQGQVDELEKEYSKKASKVRKSELEAQDFVERMEDTNDKIRGTKVHIDGGTKLPDTLDKVGGFIIDKNVKFEKGKNYQFIVSGADFFENAQFTADDKPSPAFMKELQGIAPGQVVIGLFNYKGEVKCVVVSDNKYEVFEQGDKEGINKFIEENGGIGKAKAILFGDDALVGGDVGIDDIYEQHFFSDEILDKNTHMQGTNRDRGAQSKRNFYVTGERDRKRLAESLPSVDSKIGRNNPLAEKLIAISQEKTLEKTFKDIVAADMLKLADNLGDDPTRNMEALQKLSRDTDLMFLNTKDLIRRLNEATGNSLLPPQLKKAAFYFRDLQMQQVNLNTVQQRLGIVDKQQLQTENEALVRQVLEIAQKNPKTTRVTMEIREGELVLFAIEGGIISIIDPSVFTTEQFERIIARQDTQTGNILGVTKSNYVHDESPQLKRERAERKAKEEQEKAKLRKEIQAISYEIEFLREAEITALAELEKVNIKSFEEISNLKRKRESAQEVKEETPKRLDENDNRPELEKLHTKLDRLSKKYNINLNATKFLQGTLFDKKELLKKQISALEQHTETLKVEIAHLQEELGTEVEDEKDSVVDEEPKITLDQLAKVTIQNKSLIAKEKQLQVAAAKQREKVESLNVRRQELGRDLQELNEQQKKLIDGLRVVVTSKEDIEGLQAKMAITSKKITKVIKQHKNAKTPLQIAQKDLAVLSQRISLTRENNTMLTDELNTQKNGLRDQIVAANKKTALLRKEIASLNEQLGEQPEAQEEKDEVDPVSVVTSESLSEIIDSNESLAQRRDGLKSELESSIKDVQGKVDKNKELSKDLLEKEKLLLAELEDVNKEFYKKHSQDISNKEAKNKKQFNAIKKDTSTPVLVRKRQQLTQLQEFNRHLQGDSGLKALGTILEEARKELQGKIEKEQANTKEIQKSITALNKLLGNEEKAKEPETKASDPPPTTLDTFNALKRKNKELSRQESNLKDTLKKNREDTLKAIKDLIDRQDALTGKKEGGRDDKDLEGSNLADLQGMQKKLEEQLKDLEEKAKAEAEALKKKQEEEKARQEKEEREKAAKAKQEKLEEDIRNEESKTQRLQKQKNDLDKGLGNDLDEIEEVDEKYKLAMDDARLQAAQKRNEELGDVLDKSRKEYTKRLDEEKANKDKAIENAKKFAAEKVKLDEEEQKKKEALKKQKEQEEKDRLAKEKEEKAKAEALKKKQEEEKAKAEAEALKKKQEEEKAKAKAEALKKKQEEEKAKAEAEALKKKQEEEKARQEKEEREKAAKAKQEKLEEDIRNEESKTQRLQKQKNDLDKGLGNDLDEIEEVDEKYKLAMDDARLQAAQKRNEELGDVLDKSRKEYTKRLDEEKANKDKAIENAKKFAAEKVKLDEEEQKKKEALKKQKEQEEKDRLAKEKEEKAKADALIITPFSGLGGDADSLSPVSAHGDVDAEELAKIAKLSKTHDFVVKPTGNRDDTIILKANKGRSDVRSVVSVHAKPKDFLKDLNPDVEKAKDLDKAALGKYFGYNNFENVKVVKKEKIKTLRDDVTDMSDCPDLPMHENKDGTTTYRNACGVAMNGNNIMMSVLDAGEKRIKSTVLLSPPGTTEIVKLFYKAGMDQPSIAVVRKDRVTGRMEPVPYDELDEDTQDIMENLNVTISLVKHSVEKGFTSTYYTKNLGKSFGSFDKSAAPPTPKTSTEIERDDIAPLLGKEAKARMVDGRE